MGVLSTFRSDSGERGVTLVETLVALLILSFVAVSTLAMFSQGMRLNSAGADYSAITNIAKDKCEELMSMAFDDAALTADVDYVETVSSPPVTIRWRLADHWVAQGTTEPNAIFGSDPMVSNPSPIGESNLKVLQVRVESQGVFGLGRRDITVQSIIFDNTWDD